jgi:predicted N-acetyltransferase YhbS
MNGFVLEQGFHERDRAAVVALLREYEDGVGSSLCFQQFEAELAGLPGDYAPPRGLMLLACDTASDRLIGCVALRPVPAATEACEMKRLYVPVRARVGLGRTLALAAMEEARRLATGVCALTPCQPWRRRRRSIARSGFGTPAQARPSPRCCCSSETSAPLDRRHRRSHQRQCGARDYASGLARYAKGYAGEAGARRPNRPSTPLAQSPTRGVRLVLGAP